MIAAISGDRSLKPLIIAISTWIAIFLLFKFFGPIIPEFDARISTFISATVLTALSIFIVYGFSSLKLNRTTYLAIGVIAVAGVYLAATPLVKRSKLINSSGSIPGQIPLLTYQTSTPVILTEKAILPLRNSIFKELAAFAEASISEPYLMIIILALAQLALASGFGLWIAEGIDDITHLIPVALVATIADIWSVSAGATAKIVVSSTINYFLLRFPLLASDSIPYLIGLTDFLFFAIFFQAAIRYNLGALKNAILLAASFVIAIISALFTATGLPVLPFMAALFVAGNFSKLELKKEELKQVLIFVIAILALFAIFTFMLH
ncbi:MAG: hypothetical protein Kow0029_08250 [Candidatus Rifleibacteriota bacterium]